ncbi:quinone oxidoreductase [Advenella kashmirensis WT001]|uniref:Quinone oxidoreductase n=1 Tax=Advenella kashmirensis (strain DSM 17095 / LMG 22695 / WT001) TaxID=1036672 RepID=I3UGF6_ADVKW|nr:quinone oxidoreductase [Advenella kashmirensis WT001]
MSNELDPAKLALIGSRTVGLNEVIPLANQILEGKVRGRIVVDVNT